MYRFAICDDESADLLYIRSRVSEWAKTQCLEVDVEEFPSAESFWFAYEEKKDFDVLFLDIEMGKMSGVELAKKVRSENKSIQIIFITGYMEYISEGYDVEALHYLLKPVGKEKLEEVLCRALRRIRMQEKSLLIHGTGETVRIPFYEIRWIEVQKNYVIIHGKEVYSAKQTLRKMETELDERFFKVHRSYIVNLSYVKKISKSNVTLKDGEALPLSRGLYEKLNQAFIRYF